MILLKMILLAVTGAALLMAGLAMLVLMGPAIVVIPAMLAILVVEFLWARRWRAWEGGCCKTISSKNLPSNCTLNPK